MKLRQHAKFLFYCIYTPFLRIKPKSCFTFAALIKCTVQINYYVLAYLIFENNITFLVTAAYYDPLI